MSLKNTPLDQWHEDEKKWWDKYGNYMTYQWKLTPSLNKILRTELEEDYRNFLFNSDEILLDIGCGSGWLALSFAEQGMKVHGIDLSQEQINDANILKSKSKLDNVEFECCDLINWNTDKFKGRFSSVFVNAFVHHLPEIEMEILFNKIAAVLKSGGKVYMYEPLTLHKAKNNFSIRLIDKVCNFLLAILLYILPKWFDLTNDQHKRELANGYKMSSPHERPINLEIIKKSCADTFEILEIKGWHLFSMGFAMQTMSYKTTAQRIYTWLAVFWYWLDKILLRLFKWSDFSQPQRFILCSIKLIRK